VRRIWDGSDVAQEVLATVRQEVERIQREGRLPPVLAEVSVGGSPLHERILALHAEACRQTGVVCQVFSFPTYTEHDAILQTLVKLSADPTITGITVHALPLSCRRALMAAIAPEKDVDGWHPLPFGRFIVNKRPQRLPCGADIVQLLKRAGLSLLGAHVLCLGNTSGLGGVLALLCLHENATVSAWRATTTWPSDMLQRADVLILDTDDLPALDGATVKPGAVVVDARSHANGSWPQSEGLAVMASLLIPVPGGVGPTTIARRLTVLLDMYRTPIIVPHDS
jgi:methylenetetrahydrofolate dehydrogenase (NADP+)/methenyltetrahydrofolate cyclohydrolase